MDASNEGSSDMVTAQHNGILIRPLDAADRDQWEPLWQGCLTFYKSTVAPEVTETTWRRLLDPSEPMLALWPSRAKSSASCLPLSGHLDHRQLLLPQDLFTSEKAQPRRRAGLIETIYRQGRRREPSLLADSRVQHLRPGAVR